MLNVALFDKAVKQWREDNKDLKGNMRDCSSISELLVLSNIESYNAILDRLLHHCNVININDRSYRVRDYYQE
ncbi:ATP-binding protein [Streptobacillus felis]|nr:ATP-binding protein [Streptobacillus felis]